MAELKDTYDSLDDVPEAFHELYTERDGKFEFTGVVGLKTSADVARVQNALTKEKDAHKKTKESLGKWGDLDYDDVTTKLDRIEELEEAAKGKVDEAKLEEMAQARAEKLNRKTLAPLQRDLKKATKERDELAELSAKRGKKLEKRALQDQLDPIMRSMKIAEEHRPDVLMYANAHLEKSEDGDGWFSKEGLSEGLTAGLDAKSWLAELAPKRPGWVPGSKGGGSKGSLLTPGGKVENNPWSKKHWSKHEQGQFFKKHGKEASERAAEQANSTLHATKPPQE